MKSILFFLSLFISTIAMAQQTTASNLLEQPIYDTTNIEIRSTNTFYFCSNLYKIPRDCEGKDQSNCCSFSGQISNGETKSTSGQLGCYDGTSLFWTYFKSGEIAKSNSDSYSSQIKKQMKSFKQTEIKMSVCNQETTAYKINYTTMQGHNGYEIYTYATINGQSVFIQLMSNKEMKSSKDLSSVFRQIVQF